jgi:hypothetical protein
MDLMKTINSKLAHHPRERCWTRAAAEARDVLAGTASCSGFKTWAPGSHLELVYHLGGEEESASCESGRDEA